MAISANFFGSFFLKTGKNLCPVPLFRVHSKYWCLQGQPLVPTTQAQVPALTLPIYSLVQVLLPKLMRPFCIFLNSLSVGLLNPNVPFFFDFPTNRGL